MKRILLWGAALAALGAPAARASVDMTARGQYFLPGDKAFRDIYGGGWKAGGEIGVGLTGRLGLWAGGDYFARKGRLTFTGEETKLTLVPAAAGLRYRLTTGAASLYAAAGVLVCQFKEQNPIGRVSSTGLGGTVRLGLLLRPVRGLLLHLGAGYSVCPMKPADFDIDVGGLEGGAGLAVEF